MRGLKAIGRAFDILLNALAVLAGGLLVALMLATVVKVGMRAIFGYGILGIDQISGTLMVYITFLGAAWVLRNEGHVTVDLLTALLPANAERIAQIAGSLISGVACLIVAYYSLETVELSLKRGVVVAAEIEIPRAINLALIPLGCLLLGIEFIRRALRFYRNEAVTPDVETLQV
jgi:TRAP-type C4-dicarboxylate transport system permease small subunit